MRIVFLMTAGLDRPVGRRYFPVARALVAQGHRVRMLALHPDFAACSRRRFVQDGVEVWYVGQMHARKGGSVPRHFGTLALLWVLLTATLGLIWGVICSPAEVYHLGKPQPVNGLAALIAVRLLRRRPFFVDCDDDEVRGNRLTSVRQRAVFAFWQRLLPTIAAGVTANTHYLVAELQRSGVRRVVYVPNGAEAHQFVLPPSRQLEGLRAALGLTGRRLVVYAGTVALQNHPVDLLVEAFPLVAAAVPNVDLLIVGGGEDLAVLRELVRQRGLIDRVYFTGQLPQAAVRTYLALAELSVDPVRDDPVARARSPLKLFESLALGVPVVTGAVGDRPEILAGGAAGLLVAPGDPVALAHALIDLLDDTPRRQLMAIAAREQARGYTWERLVLTWMSVYST